MYKLHNAIVQLGVNHLDDMKEDSKRVRIDAQKETILANSKKLQEKINELNNNMAEKDKLCKDMQKKVETIKDEKTKLVKMF